MKRLFFVGAVLMMALTLKAQEKTPVEYLLFEFMQVNDENASDYLQVEQFWSGIHKQRVADKTINGWDLWSLNPSGKEQGSQYLTVTIFRDLKSLLKSLDELDVVGYAKKAYPGKTDAELSEMFDKTVKSRDIAHRVIFKSVDQTKDNFEMKVGTMITIDVMKQLDDRYEQMETEIFKPWHQQMVDQGKKGNWGLARALLPAGSLAKGTHITYSMYKDTDQLAEFMEATGGESDFKTNVAVVEGLKTREWKDLKIGRLEMIVR